MGATNAARLAAGAWARATTTSSRSGAAGRRGDPDPYAAEGRAPARGRRRRRLSFVVAECAGDDLVPLVGRNLLHPERVMQVIAGKFECFGHGLPT